MNPKPYPPNAVGKPIIRPASPWGSIVAYTYPGTSIALKCGGGTVERVELPSGNSGENNDK